MGDASQNEEKVDRAFEVVEGLEDRSGSDKLGCMIRDPSGENAHSNAQTGKSEKKTAKNVESPTTRSGLRLKFSMDALVSESDTQASSDSKLRPGAAKLLNIDFTLPYIWRIPVFGKTALKMVRRLQRDEYPDSVREILRSLRK